MPATGAGEGEVDGAHGKFRLSAEAPGAWALKASELYQGFSFKAGKPGGPWGIENLSLKS